MDVASAEKSGAEPVVEAAATERLAASSRILRSAARGTLPVIVALLCVSVSAFHKLTHDDAFIAYRYGRNLALGRGLVFNPGERVLGFTSPLHVLLAALVHLLVGQEALPHVMVALGCAGWTAQALAVHRLFSRASRATLSATASLLALAVAVGGANSAWWLALETNLAVALSLWALVVVLEARFRLGAVLAGAACLARPDAALMALVLAGFVGVHARRRLLTAAVAFAAVVAPWVAFAMLYFGSPLPLPLFVKFQRTTLPDYAEHLARFATKTLLGVTDPAPELIIAAWLAAVAGALLSVRRERRSAWLFAYGALHVAAYLWLRPFRQHEWHLYPAVLVFCLGAWSFAAEGLRWAARRLHPCAALLGGGLLLGFYLTRTAMFARSYPTAYWFGARHSVYRAAAEYLKSNVRSSERVAAVEVGTLGYYSDARFYDLSGLVTKSPVIVARPPRPYAWLAADAQYPSLKLGDAQPVRRFESSGFALRLYVER